MATQSKLLFDTIKNYSCLDVIHTDGKGCVEMIGECCTGNIFKCFQFFIPISLIPVALKIKNLNADILTNCAKEYFNGSMSLWIAGNMALVFICSFSRLLGRFYFPTTILIPAMLSGIVTASFMSDKTGYMYGHVHGAAFVEAMLRRIDERKRSDFVMTILFMISNGILLHGLRKTGQHVLWFYKPQKVTEQKSNSTCLPLSRSPIMDQIIPVKHKVCLHPGDCDSYILQGVSNYFKIGIAAEMLRAIFARFNKVKANPWNIFKVLYEHKNWPLVGFFVAYVGIYRISHCLLNRYHEEDTSNNHLMSSILSGISFAFYPRYTVLSHAITTAIETTWRSMAMKYKSKDKTKKIRYWLNEIDKIPLSKLVFIILFGVMAHIRIFYPWLCPSLVQNFIGVGASNKDSMVIKNYLEEVIKGDTPSYILYIFGLRDSP